MTRSKLRQIIRTIYVFSCGYCGITEEEMGSELAIDHFQPRSRGGTDDIDNLAYACHSCNAFKADSWDSDKPIVLHPLHDDLPLHLVEQDDGSLVGLTDAGRSHIAILHLNRKPLIRRRKVYAFRFSFAENQQSLLDRLTSIEQTVGDLQTALLEFERKRRLP